VMCAVQHHLKRMLAFATIAQVGLFLAGLGLLSPEGVAGTAIWVVADGLVKAGLFACVAILQHRFGVAEVAELHGRGPRAVGVIFVLGALAIATLPLTGKALIEEGEAWLPAVMVVVTGVVGGTLLRAAGRIFWGLGDPPPRDPAGDEPDEELREREGGRHVLHVLAGVLVGAGIAWGFVPGLRAAAGRAASAFTDQRGYAAAMLDGQAPPPPHVELVPPAASAYLYAFLALALALTVAAIGVWGRVRTPAPLEALRRLHNGRPGDYVTWTVLGAAVLIGVFTL
jgi:multicomponent Na+:H+ antiporter subunit D